MPGHIPGMFRVYSGYVLRFSFFDPSVEISDDLEKRFIFFKSEFYYLSKYILRFSNFKILHFCQKIS